ncbi:MAG: hypothetical protein V1716_00995 [Candidatus Uhrbacteria bacterium]
MDEEKSRFWLIFFVFFNELDLFFYQSTFVTEPEQKPRKKRIGGRMLLISTVSESNGGTDLAHSLQSLLGTGGQVISVCTERDFLEEIGRLTETVKPDELVVFVFLGSIFWDVPRRNPLPCPEEISLGGSRRSIPRCVQRLRTNRNPALVRGRIFVYTYTKEPWVEDVKKTGCVLLEDSSPITLFSALRAAGIR